MSEHTQNTWEYRRWAQDDSTIAKMREVGMEPTERMGNNGERYITDSEGVVCAVYATTTPKRGKGHDHADDARDKRAHLIAAAPDLLAALEQALPYVEDAEVLGGFKKGVVDGHLRMIRNAIARATCKDSLHVQSSAEPAPNDTVYFERGRKTDPANWEGGKA